MNKEIFLHAKDWIITNQKNDGAICWDEKGKFDAWDHSECLLALAIFEEWDHFDKGLEYVFNNINSEGLIISETIKDIVTKDYYEPHHAAYIFLPLVQKYMIDGDASYIQKYQKKLKLIFEGMMKFRDTDGLFFWALDTKGFADNSLITASCSLELSRRAYSFLCKNVLQEEDQEDTNFFNLETFHSSRFNRDGIDRARFSMDSYYPYLIDCGDVGNIDKLLKKFYVEGLGIKCVEEEPWVTIAESSECCIALHKAGKTIEAKKIFNDVMQHMNKDGIFPTGYQYKLDINWPDEHSTWTNAAAIIAADCLYDLTQKDKALLL